MAAIISVLVKILAFCYKPFQNYGAAIILFTFISKIVLFPLSIWVQKNSIKMVKIQPEINEIKVKYYGDREAIDEQQTLLMKKVGYNAFASIVPMVIQIALLLAMIAAIKQGMLESGLNLRVLGADLTVIPIYVGGLYYLVPFIAGFSSYVFCYVQNKCNVLQESSSKGMQIGTTVASVGLSLYLGFFVQVGVAIYWMASNLTSIIVIFACNAMINPKNYIDYDRLLKSKEEMRKLDDLSAKKQISREDKKREKEDYKKFFSVDKKKLVFYSEGSGFYKYFQGIIEYLLDNTNIIIHYITSDPKDQIFEKAKFNAQIHPYYIGENKLITLMMKMDADVVVMTMPDLDNFHIKRSYVRKDVEYIFVPHALHSINLMMRTGCIDNFDTVLVTGKHQEEEIRKTEEIYKVRRKNLIECGYPLLDSMLMEYEKTHSAERNETATILIAPSWQDQGIMDMCLEEMLDRLKSTNYQVIMRPHPQYVRHKPEYLDQLARRYEAYPNVEIQVDFSSNNTVFDADVLITDWSGIAYEYAFTTLKPVLFIDTPMKVQNPEYQKIGVVPMNVWMRKEIGMVLMPDEMSAIEDTVCKMFENKDKFRDIIRDYREHYIYNLGHSAEIGAKYIIGQLQAKVAERRSNKSA